MVCSPSPPPSPTRGEGEHRVIFYAIPMAKIQTPLTPALSHQGRGGTSSYFLRNSNGQNSTPPHPIPLPPGERDRVRGGIQNWSLDIVWNLACLREAASAKAGVSPLLLETTLRSQCPPSTSPLPRWGEG